MIPLHRLWAVCMLSLVVFSLVAVRLGYLQIYRHANLSARAQREQTSHSQMSSRGAIFDRAGYVLAMNLRGGSCFADPKRIKNPSAAARSLAPVLSLPAPMVEAKLKQRRRFVWLARRLDRPASYRRRTVVDGEWLARRRVAAQLVGEGVHGGSVSR